MKLAPPFLGVFTLLFCCFVRGQIEVTQDLAIDHFLAEIEVTNNGISPIPAFTLGEPALLMRMNLGKDRFSIEPLFALSIKNLKPWSFGVFARYNVIQEEHVILRFGVNPSVNFQVENYMQDGNPVELIQSRRYFGTEVAPIFRIAKKWWVGFYYLRAYGFDEGPKNGHFYGFNTSLSRVRISRYFYFSLVPQVFHVRIDGDGGYYTSANFALHFSDSPFSLATTMNKALRTDIASDREFNWNISLVYRID